MSINIYNSAALPVPVKIIVEARRSSRVSLGKNEVIVRLPKHISVADKEKIVKQFLIWAKQQIQDNNYYQFHQNKIEFYHNKQLHIFDTPFTIELEYIASGRNKLSYRGDHILKIYLLQNIPEVEQKHHIQRFLLRFTEKYFLSKIQERTIYWNERYFKEKIEKIDIKHTVSRWGSCSSSRKLSFATKLLLLPCEIIDYVIVHELAHLKEMNHSPKFWKHVENAMPAYQTHRKWLQQHGSKIDF